MARNTKKYTSLVVYNSITNTLDDNKLDTQRPFSFIEFLNYITVLDNADEQNLEEYKKYITNWNKTNYKSKKNIKVNIRDIYINFFNDLTLNYSTSEERRFFDNIDLNDPKALTQAIPFYSKKVKDIVSYYRNRRNTFKKDLREVKNKGSNESIKNLVKNSVIDFFQSADVQKSESFSLSTTFHDLEIELEEAYDTDNDYFDIDPSATKSDETFKTNDINYNATIDFNASLIDIINKNNIKIKELAPFNITINVNRVFKDYFKSDDFIDYNVNNDKRENFSITLEAELAKRFTGADYYYLSTNETSFVSGTLFKAEDQTSNALNVNFPSIRQNSTNNPVFEREVGFYFEPTKFSVLRIDGEFNKTLKIDLKSNYVYVFPDPNKYGDILNASTTKRLNPYDFYFKPNSYKNISSSFGRKIVKSNERNHYFHSYDSKENKLYNINNSSSLDKNYKDITNFGTIVKNESDIYGNEYVSFIKEPVINRNIRTGAESQEDTPLKSGKTVDFSVNKYGFVLKEKTLLQRKTDTKFIYFNNIITNEFVILSASPFNIVLDKLKGLGSGAVIYQANNNIKDFNIYGDTYSMLLSSHNIIDGYKIKDKKLVNIPSTPFIIEKDSNNLSDISNDCLVDDIIYKAKITSYNPTTGFSDKFYYEFYSYDTNSKVSNEMLTRNNTKETFFEENFFFNENIIFNRLENVNLSHNSELNEFILTTTYKDLNDSPIIHLLKYYFLDNKMNIRKNVIYRDKFNISPKNTITGNGVTSLSGQFKLSALNITNVPASSGYGPGVGPELSQELQGPRTRTLFFNRLIRN
jgi:hypothetical protein